jgi:hypothetical protein
VKPEGGLRPEGRMKKPEGKMNRMKMKGRYGVPDH